MASKTLALKSDYNALPDCSVLIKKLLCGIGFRDSRGEKEAV